MIDLIISTHKLISPAVSKTTADEFTAKVYKLKKLFDQYKRIKSLWKLKKIDCENIAEEIHADYNELISAKVNFGDELFSEKQDMFDQLEFVPFSKCFEVDEKLTLLPEIEFRKELAYFFFYPILVGGYSVDDVFDNLFEPSTKLVIISIIYISSY